MANTKVTGDLIASSTIATGNIADNAVTSDKISGITTAHITEGSNLYYTNARADARITAATTSDLTEGTNLYYTDARADARVNLQTGANLSLSNKSTSDLSEGTNLYYTDARADARAALLVDSAPSTLNTLNELAAALGDDPNFATTVTNSIATKLPLAGGTLSGSLSFINTSGDHSRITYTQGDGTTGDVWSHAFYQNSLNQASIDFFATTEAAGDGNIKFRTGTSETMRLTNSGNVGIGTADGPDDVNSKLHVYKNAGDNTIVELLRLDCGENNHNVGKGGSIIWRDINVYNNTASITAQRTGAGSSSSLQFGLRGSEKMRITSGGDIQVQGGDIFLNSGTSYNDKGIVYLSNERTAIISDIVNATANGDTSLDFQTRKSGTRASAMFIDEFRNVGIGTASPGAKLEVVESTANTDCVVRIKAARDAYLQFSPANTTKWGLIADYPALGDFTTYNYPNNFNAIVCKDNKNITTNLSGGNFGIGTTSPSNKLEVAGNINVIAPNPYIWVGESGSGGSAGFIGWHDAGDYLFLGHSYGGAFNKNIVINSSGNVGIGTTSPSWQLEVENTGTVRTAVSSTTNGSSGLYFRVFNSGTQVGNGTIATQNNGDMKFFTGTSGEAERMRITSGGTLQVGTVSTQIQIQPNGDAYTTQTRGWQLSGAIGNAAYPSYGFRNSTGEGMMSTSATNLSLVCGGSVKLHMDSRTNTSYTPDGLWNAAAQPTILSSSSGGGFYLGYQDNGSGLYAQAYGFLTKSTDGLGNTSSRDCIQVKDANTGTINLSITNLGAITARGSIASNGNPSDVRLKENIKPIDNALSKIKKIQGVSFDWKPSDSIVDIKEDYGFIAQEVQKSLPEIIKEDRVGMLSMRYNSVIPILVEGMKELEKIVSELKKEIIELKSK